ncbi:MAG: GTPase HflX [Planctomycetes bacterium]|nr:GTPase HflX [Planctomycetota bacterium]
MDKLEQEAERAVLFGPVYFDSYIKNEAILDELGRLVEAAGGNPVGRMIQSIRSPNPATFFGSGKVEELKKLIMENDAQLAVFDEELSPAQGRNLEQCLEVRVIDRSELILDIFAGRAQTYQAKLQVELAQLKYKLPRLKRMWTHLDRIHSAIGARGPGETQIETDRRLIRVKIQEYNEKLKAMELNQQRTIEGRKEFKVSLVGYTNAGKSTLMRSLTDPDVYVADQLFATLDTLTRKLKLPNAGQCLLSDTVGFVSKLPHHLVTSFHATLSEAKEADLLLHVTDASDPAMGYHIETVEKVLEDMGCDNIPTILIANKIDREDSGVGLAMLNQSHPDHIALSAHSGQGLDELLNTITRDMSSNWKNMPVHIPYSRGDIITNIKLHATIISENAGDQGMNFELKASEKLIHQLHLNNYLVTNE